MGVGSSQINSTSAISEQAPVSAPNRRRVAPAPMKGSYALAAAGKLSSEKAAAQEMQRRRESYGSTSTWASSSASLSSTEQQYHDSSPPSTSSAGPTTCSSTEEEDEQWAATDRATRSFFNDLPTDLLLTLLQHLPPPSFHRLARTCRALHTLVSTNSEALYRHRVLTQFRLEPQRRQHAFRMRFEGEEEQTWCDMYWRLSVLKTRWVGLALDPVSGFGMPYAMELIWKTAVAAPPDGRAGSGGGVRVDGVCRWRTVGDAVTKVTGRVHVEDGYSTSIAFKEHKLVKGPVDTVAVPNAYVAECFGSVMLGMYDPGFGRRSRGVFALVMEECFWGTDDTEPIEFMPGRTHFGVVATVDSARRGAYSRCRLTFLHSALGVFEMDLPRPCAAWVELASSGDALHFDSGEDAQDGKKRSWWEDSTGEPCLPDGKVDCQKFGNMVIGFFTEPELGCFFIGL
ncbi:hypothetical protein HDU87_001769 [Geranomyces variabilis]|uniref:F-box domain-containing protein n=1 Tax=Geranomyces variabilis TaxID=109894 RepID=A0AAD5TRX8_9FUNG|nr:hypothetical protein HDU87_001769 [Geranomyces variabilis]